MWVGHAFLNTAFIQKVVTGTVKDVETTGDIDMKTV